MFADRFTLQTRLILAVILPCLALGLVGIASLNSMQGIQNQSEKLYSNTSSPMRAMAEVASRIPRMRVGIDMMLLQDSSLRDEKGVLTRVKETRLEDIPEMRQAIQYAVEAQVIPEQKAEVEALLKEFERMVSRELNPMLAAFENGDMETARQIYKSKYAKTYGVLRKHANRILDALLVQAETQFQVSNVSYESGQNRLFLIIGLGVLISGAFSVIIISSLKKRVAYLQSSMSTAAQEMALDTRIDLKGKDELAVIARSFNDFISRVHESIQNVAMNSQELATTAQQVSDHAALTQGHCTSQRDRTTQVATAIHQLGATVEEVASNASQAAQVAKQATEQAQSGGEVVDGASTQIDSLRQDLEQATDVVESLAVQVEDISSILDTIRGISEQTNLLALNAAIEAARAGEQGRGFAVVADEVRKLASLSADSTEEIQGVINRLQEESTKAVSAMSNGRDQSAIVVDKAAEANSSLKQISAHISHISDQNIQVATATEEQSSVVGEINRNVEDINLLTEETANVAQQLNSSSSHLKQLSGQLDTLVGNFKL
ncbi:methyl-accepting chemotaxis protein [Vibrio tubiashii]|uniref:methyl-accepting chemotaxis protein n=1 Tax=Vibrio tubiashii TaxID=29498 RepID=UPI001EFCE95F|nr:methyl-accepting chemotaxis protein [Vibrio tubiashii]MCG9580984.1 methyl-accepting chemotaxis protein [Vibrio tubiashii]MCG9614575.1 methyl-accepting chemotaxis protein [Vibrio tubiashii]MCG9688978.1 methyl-accepting chemotaxis protein [Vibrio tubiashii]